MRRVCLNDCFWCVVDCWLLLVFGFGVLVRLCRVRVCGLLLRCYCVAVLVFGGCVVFVGVLRCVVVL